jgi:hypothetical protein
MKRPRFAARGHLTVFPEFAGTREEAIAQGRTYYKRHQRCEHCGTSLVWVTTDNCMGCTNFAGAPYPRRDRNNEFVPPPTPKTMHFEDMEVAD